MNRSIICEVDVAVRLGARKFNDRHSGLEARVTKVLLNAELHLQMTFLSILG
jgi:hypothetical protein